MRVISEVADPYLDEGEDLAAGLSGSRAVTVLEKELGSWRRAPAGLLAWLAWVVPVHLWALAAFAVLFAFTGAEGSGEGVGSLAVALGIAALAAAATWGCRVLTRRWLAPGRLLVESLARWMRRFGPVGGRGHVGPDAVSWVLDRTYAFRPHMISQILLAAIPALPALGLGVGALIYGLTALTRSEPIEDWLIGTVYVALLATWLGGPSVVVMRNVAIVNNAYLGRGRGGR